MIFEVLYNKHQEWFDACQELSRQLPVFPQWEKKNFYGILGDIKEKNTEDLFAYFEKRPGLDLQLVKLYLTQGIQQGQGYQSCAGIALSALFSAKNYDFKQKKVLDLGIGINTLSCALGLQKTHGTDRIPAFISAARKLDELLGKKETLYWSQDFLLPWQLPTKIKYSALFYGLVWHQLTDPEKTTFLLGQSFQALEENGSLWITLPSNTLANRESFQAFLECFPPFGFSPVPADCGLVCNHTDGESVFWMFVIHARKKTETLSPNNQFPSMETFKRPSSRSKKRERIRQAIFAENRLQHKHFLFLSVEELFSFPGDWDFYGIRRIQNQITD